MRSPISRVRSVTETSMMFIMPTPPTTSEIVATASSRSLIDLVMDDIMSVISVRLRMSKSSDWLGAGGGVRATGP